MNRLLPPQKTRFTLPLTNRTSIQKKVDDIRAKTNEADAKIGAKLSEADAKFGQLKTDGVAKFEQVRKETGKELHDTVDKFDKTVERKTAEAKSGLSSWFGFGK